MLDDAHFLHEIKALGKALRLPSAAADPSPTTSSSSSSSSSLWKWKPLAVLSRIRSRRFDCRFSLHVHSITALPPSLAGAALRVHWRSYSSSSAAAAAPTHPAHAVRGTARFDETLTSICSLSDTRRSEARPFLIYATTVPDELDLGRHRVDLARLLPVSLEDLEAGEISGEWGTSFRLSGKAEGAFLNVSFGFSVTVAHGRRRSRKADRSFVRQVGSFQDRNQLSRSWSCFVSPSADDVVALYPAIDSHSDHDTSGEQSRAEPTAEDECDEPDFVVIDKGIMVEEGYMKLGKDEQEISSRHMDDKECCLLPELESAFSGLSVQQSERSSSCAEVESDIDDLTESVASEFLSMLEMESPTGEILKQFREECLIDDDGTNDSNGRLGDETNRREFEEDIDLSSIVHDVEMEHLKASQVMKSKLMAQTLVDAETEALMLEWGLNEDTFQGSPLENRGGFGSPIELPLEEPVEVPSLDEGFYSDEELWVGL